MSESAAESFYREGDAAHDAGQLDAAERLLRAALVVDPAHWMARYTLAVVLQDAGKHDAALPLYAQALAANPRHAKAWNNYGVALQYLRQTDEAIAAYRRALAIDPLHGGALGNLSGLLAQAGRVDEARLLLAPHCNPVAPNLFDLRRALMLPPVPASTADLVARRTSMLADLRRIAERPPRLVDPLREVGRTPFYLAYQPDSDREILQTLALLYRRACPELSFAAPGCGADRSFVPGARIRVGFASFFFYEHSVARAMHGLIEHLPRDRFEVIVIFIGGRAGDDMAARIAETADRSIETAYDLDTARRAIAGLELDVLCLPDFGMDPLSYFLGFARLAPVQCTTWGHAETSGLETIDWFVSAEVFERQNAQEDYSERLYCLPAVASPSWYPRPPALPGGSSRIPVGAGPSYFCAQTLYKLHPDFDAMIAGILQRQPAARLYLVLAAEGDWNRMLRHRLENTLGSLLDQVVWLEKMSRADYQATLVSADIILDPPHFTGGNTSLEAFAVARPIVTLEGLTMRSRFTAGFYRAMGLPEMISRTPEEYIHRAVALGTDKSLRHDAGRKIAAASSILFEDPAVISGWAGFFDRAMALARNGA